MSIRFLLDENLRGRSGKPFFAITSAAPLH